MPEKTINIISKYNEYKYNGGCDACHAEGEDICEALFNIKNCHGIIYKLECVQDIKDLSFFARFKELLK